MYKHVQKAKGNYRRYSFSYMTDQQDDVITAIASLAVSFQLTVSSIVLVECWLMAVIDCGL